MGIAQRDTRTNTATITVAASDSIYRTRADYVCDGTDDAVEINLAIERIKSVGGIVRLMAGNFYLHTTGILQRQTIYLEGEGLGATYLSAAAGHSLTAGSGLITLDTLDVFDGGGVRGISLVGDGTISGETGKAALDATIDGISITNVGALFNYYVQGNAIHKFRRGWNGEGSRERCVPFENNEIWYNSLGVYCGEHPNFAMNDCRSNDVAIGGVPYDVNFRGMKICYNRVGITGRDPYEYKGATHCMFTGCQFFGNSEISLILYSDCFVNGCQFGVPDTNVINYLKINSAYNTIGGSHFYSQIHPYGATDSAIWFAESCSSNSISGNYFRNPAGRVFSISDGKSIRATRFTNNIITLNGQPVISESAGGGEMVDCEISDNSLYISGAVDYPIFELASTGAGTAGGNCWRRNSIYTTGGSSVPTCVFKGDLGLSVFSDNDLRRMVANSVPIFDASTDFTGAEISNNPGYGPYSPIMCVHGSTAATARPSWPGVVQWIGSVEPTNAVSNDVWINTG